MSQHENHPVHEYSLETYRNEAPRLGKRCALVFGVYVDRRLPMSDRQVKNALHFSDMNSVRPRINDMIKMGIIYMTPFAFCSKIFQESALGT